MKVNMITNPVHIKGKLYGIQDGIKLAKTLYGNDFDKIPEHLKHDDIKVEWDKHEGIEQNLYFMSLSEDPETLKLCAEILLSKGIEFHYQEYNQYSGYGVGPRKYIGGIHVFLDGSTYFYNLTHSSKWSRLD